MGSCILGNWFRPSGNTVSEKKSIVTLRDLNLSSFKSGREVDVLTKAVQLLSMHSFTSFILLFVKVYGIVTLALNWVPGVVAAVHLLSMQRRRLPPERTLLYVVLLIVFYPLIPVAAYFNLLWTKPVSARRVVMLLLRGKEVLPDILKSSI